MGYSRLVLLVCLLSILPAQWWLAAKSPIISTDQTNPAAGAHASYVEAIAGTKVSFEMVAIPGGTFVMGSPESESGRSADEGPAHEVTIRPFWIGKMEVTWDEYDLYAFSQGLTRRSSAKKSPADLAADAVTRPTPPYADETFGYGRENKQPAISMTWHAAMEYCRWLSAKTGKTYRLPTEAEWEYAARAGTKTAYSFGDDPAKLGEYAWYTRNSDALPHPVGQKKPNPWGLHDMHGNLAEWCLDKYDSKFYATFQPGKPVVAPVLLPDEERYPHAVRGGSWDDEARQLRSAARRASSAEWSLRDPQRPQSIWWHTEAIFVGFRIVRPVEEQENLKGFQSKVIKK